MSQPQVSACINYKIVCLDFKHNFIIFLLARVLTVAVSAVAFYTFVWAGKHCCAPHRGHKNQIYIPTSMLHDVNIPQNEPTLLMGVSATVYSGNKW